MPFAQVVVCFFEESGKWWRSFFQWMGLWWNQNIGTVTIKKYFLQFYLHVSQKRRPDQRSKRDVNHLVLRFHPGEVDGLCNRLMKKSKIMKGTFKWIYYLPSRRNRSRRRRWICWKPLPQLLQSFFPRTDSSNTETWWSRRDQMLLVLWTPWLVTIWCQISATFGKWAQLMKRRLNLNENLHFVCYPHPAVQGRSLNKRAIQTKSENFLPVVVGKVSSFESLSYSVNKKNSITAERVSYLLHHRADCWQINMKKIFWRCF